MKEHDAALNKKLRYWQNRIALTKALMAFLRKHPAVASRTINGARARSQLCNSKKRHSSGR